MSIEEITGSSSVGDREPAQKKPVLQLNPEPGFKDILHETTLPAEELAKVTLNPDGSHDLSPTTIGSPPAEDPNSPHYIKRSGQDYGKFG